MSASNSVNIAIKTALTRKEKNWTQTDLARKAGVSRDTIARIEAGDSDHIAYGTIKHILKALDYELDLSYSPPTLTETPLDSDFDVRQWVLHDYLANNKYED